MLFPPSASAVLVLALVLVGCLAWLGHQIHLAWYFPKAPPHAVFPKAKEPASPKLSTSTNLVAAVLPQEEQQQHHAVEEDKHDDDDDVEQAIASNNEPNLPPLILPQDEPATSAIIEPVSPTNKQGNNKPKKRGGRGKGSSSQKTSSTPPVVATESVPKEQAPVAKPLSMKKSIQPPMSSGGAVAANKPMTPLKSSTSTQPSRPISSIPAKTESLLLPPSSAAAIKPSSIPSMEKSSATAAASLRPPPGLAPLNNRPSPSTLLVGKMPLNANAPVFDPTAVARVTTPPQQTLYASSKSTTSPTTTRKSRVLMTRESSSSSVSSVSCASGNAADATTVTEAYNVSINTNKHGVPINLLNSDSLILSSPFVNQFSSESADSGEEEDFLDMSDMIPIDLSFLEE